MYYIDQQRKELNERYQKHIDYLFKNYKDPNKLNSNLDLACENIRELEAVIHELQVYVHDFNTFKQIMQKKLQQKIEEEKGRE